MSLLASEVQRIRAELGYNVMGVNAEPYIGVVAIFNSVIQNYITAGASTTSATAVAAATTPAVVTLTLASITGFTAGDRIIVDLDARQESALIERVNGLGVDVQLSGVHSGTYPVTVEGGESLVREVLRQLVRLAAPNGAMEKAANGAGIRKVDEIEFFGGGQQGSRTRFDELIRMREYWRDQLAATLGVERLNGLGGGGSNCEAY